ncbi:MAG TPA: hypothetical protein VHL09_08400, partial [Dehalococcoidia bacterium]|nr:hypothetical protein [Dehalococcoidia bacterium]
RTFGTNGVRRVAEPGLVVTDISPQLDHRTTPAFRVAFVYGTGIVGPTSIRYTLLDRFGATIVAPRTLAQADGTARHGWFRVVNSENRSIAVWHRRVPGADMAVFANQYAPVGTPLQAADVQVTPAGGATEEALNPVVAPRPVAINSTQREYGVAWQYRANNASPFEIRFSRLDRNAQVLANPPAPAPPTPTSNVRVIFPGAPGWPAATDAIDPQLVNTYTHEPWANPPAVLPVGTALPAWSPGYGLAWLGRPVGGGPRTLYFTVLDENGIRAQLPQPPPNPSAIAPIAQISRPGADVGGFHLIWNGRTFRLTWTEIQGATIRHLQTALTRQGSQVVHDQPSAALLRATLINGATNINNTVLPNVNNGYGWGRVNLRQSLAPSPPITFQVRDDNAVGPGRMARYLFYLPPGTALLRATLTWNDPPGARLINRLHLRIRTGGQTFQGNTWQGAPNDWQSRPVAAGTPFQIIENVEQIVVPNPPTGVYTVDVIAEVFPANAFNQLNAQPFALVFVGSGPEVRFGAVPAG